MASEFFQSYRFKNPHSDYVETVSGWSYVWAGLFGPFYLLVKQFWGLFFLYGLILQPLLTVGAFLLAGFVGGALGPISTSPDAVTFFVVVLVVPLYIVAVSKMTIAGIRTGYLRMGWQEK